MDLNRLLNREESTKRRPLGELSTNATLSRKFLKQDGPPSSKWRVHDDENVPQTPLTKKKISLPPLSEITGSILVSQHEQQQPLTPAKTPSRTGQHFLYGVQNSKRKQEAFFNVTSNKDFHGHKRLKVVTPSKGPLENLNLAPAGEQKSPQVSLKSTKKMIWDKDASLMAAVEFKKLYDLKGSSSFLKKEYQAVADKLNQEFKTSKFSETAVRNRKGLFQSLSMIYTHIRNHPQLGDKFDDLHVPHLTNAEWSQLALYFEPAYIRKFRIKTDNNDLHTVCGMFKKRVQSQAQLERDLKLRDIMREMMTKGLIAPRWMMAFQLKFSGEDLASCFPSLLDPGLAANVVSSIDLGGIESGIQDEDVAQYCRDYGL